MPLTFYPHPDEAQKGTIEERIDVLMDAALRYKAVVLDTNTLSPSESHGKSENNGKRSTPREQIAAFNWEEIARVLREIRELPEADKQSKVKKGELLSNLAEVYEVLRSAKMSKLEAVRLALISEANQLRGSSSQVA